MQSDAQSFFELRNAVAATISGNYCARYGHDEGRCVKVERAEVVMGTLRAV